MVKKWQFFLGSPKRFLYTVLGILIIVAAIEPTWAHLAINNIIEALVPLPPIIFFVFIFTYGIKVMLSGLKIGVRKNSHPTQVHA